MKRVRQRSLISFLIIAGLALGLIWFCVQCSMGGQKWVRYFGPSYFGSGTIYDRNAVTLYDGANNSYADSADIRKAVMHLVGDDNIATSMRSVQADRLSGYHPITGTAFGHHDIYLTIDSALNATAYEALGGKKGTVGVYNYKTGEILCLVSAPAYDPVNPPGNIDSEQYSGAYINRFFTSKFVPGSIFKVVTAAAAIETDSNWENFRYTCTGKIAFGNHSVTCLNGRAHGPNLTLQDALAKSCNCAFAQLALDMGGDTLENYTRMAGLLDSYEIGGVTTAAGSFDVGSPKSIDLAWSASGQYHDEINPASFMALMGSIANDGEATEPILIQKETFSKTKIPSARGESSGSYSTFRPETCAILKEMMRNNVLETYGQANFGDLEICAKSGTAEVGENNAPHSWFSGFLDDPDNPLAFIVLVENGGSGANVAGAVASKVLLEATS